ncbi:UrcA family protein [Aurantiacibacter suaedae]|uniref:UrcA family protein n=1 Tax=Aurantiacibacter suaedae TaxID=2545755 RepID=UPI0010F432DC|nr:UrcA family protein [Aurantiacibacter suaedae]
MQAITIKLAIAASALALAPTVSAAEGEQRSTRVSYADLDLATAEGVAELDRRIDSAAREVCEADRQTTGTRLESRAARECVETARNQLDRHFAQIKRDAKLGG